MSVKVELGQWYRNEIGHITKCVYIIEHPNYRAKFLMECGDGSAGFVQDYEVGEHLPDCTGFDWEPPKPEAKYRPFRNAEEFKPHREKWVMRAHRGFENEVGCYRIEGYDDEGVWIDKSRKSTYKQEFESNRRFEDGTPFGVLDD